MLDPQKASTVWTLLPDFDHLTRGGARCSNCGNIKQPHHHGVFRMQTMDEVDGFWDLCEDCIHGAAHMLGWSTPANTAASAERIKVLESALDLLEDKYEGARTAQMTLARQLIAAEDALE